MFRYDDATKAAVQPAPTAEGAPGFYTDSPSGPSIVRAEHLNNIQEELCNAITGAGIVLTKGSQTQLLQAIQAFASGASSWTTGDVKFTWKAAPDAGWIFANDGTVGDATSGASTRANSDCEDLFKFLWNTYADIYAPVTGGRGISADADWTAHKKIALLKTAGRSPLVAGAGNGLTVRTAGASGGEETHLLTVPEMPPHNHSYIRDRATVSDGTVSHQNSDNAAGPEDTTSTGGGAAHNNMHPYATVNLMVKL